MELTRIHGYRSLSKQLVYALFGFSIAVTTVFTFTQFYLDWKREDGAFTSDSSEVVRIAAVAVSEPLWNRNSAGLESQIDALFQRVEVHAVRISNENHRVEVERTKDEKLPASPLTVSVKVTVDGAGDIGFLEVDFSNAEVIDRLETRLITLIFLNTLKALLVSSMIYYFVQYRIGKPLNALTTYFRAHPKASVTASSDKAFQRKSPFNDEISELIDHISAREWQLGVLIEDQEAKITSQSQKISESETIIAQEKARAEATARLAQLGEMATGIAHEINNPLAIISGHSYRLRKKKDGSMPAEATILDVSTGIERMVNRIASIIRGLKSYARDGSGDPFSPVSPGNILRDMMTMVVGRLIAKNIEMNVKDNTSSESLFECREVQISQVLVILTNNALDAVKNFEKPWIELHAEEDADHVIFKLTDCGPGIPREVQAKLFKPFFTTKGVGEGTGLGLSIAIDIVKAHQGDIYIDNSVRNTCFVVKVPKKHAAVAPSAA